MRHSFIVFFILLSCGTASSPQSSASQCLGLAEKDLIITELMIDPDGTDTGHEWLELFNPQPQAVNLKGLTLFATDAAGTEKSIQLKGGRIDSGASFTLGDSKDPELPSWLDASYGTMLGSFGQGNGRVGVRCGEVTVDEVRWVTASRAGHSRMLDPKEGTWCDAPETSVYEIAAGNSGSPGEPNPPCLAASTCLDEDGSTRPIVSPRPETLVITEVMAAPKVATDSVGEWFELFSVASVDQNGLTVATSTGSSTIESGTCLHLEAGDFGLIARSADPFINGGLPTPLAHFAGSFSSNNERLRLLVGEAGIDEVAFFKSTSGASWQLDSVRLSAEVIDFKSNDDPTSFCLATTRWPDGGGDFGTPGAPNSPCKVVKVPEPNPPDAGAPTQPTDATSCLDAHTRRARAIKHPGTKSISVTEIMADPTVVSDDQGEWFEALTTASFDLNGVTLGSDGPTTSTLGSVDCRSVDAGTVLIFARTLDPLRNGGLPKVDGLFTFSLGNSGSRFVRIVGGTGSELARLAYTSTTPGASFQKDPTTGALCVTPATTPTRSTPGKRNVSCP